MNRRDLLKFAPAAAALAATAASAAAKKPRLRSAICAYSFRDPLKAGTMKYDDLVHLAVDLDVDGLDLTVYWFPDTSDAFLLPLRRLAYKSGVAIYSISVRTDMCRATPELRAAEVEAVKKWVDVAEKLGAGHIRVFGGNVPKGSTEDQTAEWVAEVLSRSAEYAGTKGVILGLENHGGITERAERILEIVKKVNSPWAAVNLDSGNFRSDSYEQFEMCAPYAVNVQMKTEVRGKGGKVEPADWPRFLRLLNKGGYRGYAALEYEDKEDPIVAVPRWIAKLRRDIKEVGA